MSDKARIFGVIIGMLCAFAIGAFVAQAEKSKPCVELSVAPTVHMPAVPQLEEAEPARVAASPPPAPPVPTPVDLVDIMGDWEGPEHKPLPSVKIARPDAKRKYKRARPDVNVKFQVPIPGVGIYEGGCDAYDTGKAFCRIHDPADKENYKSGVRIEGTLKAERIGAAIRLNILDGDQILDLVPRPGISL